MGRRNPRKLNPRRGKTSGNSGDFFVNIALG
jgi:hypothetical protein